MAAGQVRWSRVTGLLSNAVANLTLLQWVPRTFSEWVAPNGDVWSIPLLPTTVFSPHLLVYALQDSCASILWQGAAKHVNGAGLSSGLSFSYSMQIMFKYRRERIYDRTAALETIMVGGCWPPHRKYLANMIGEEQDVCSLCGHAPCDELHQFWTCSALADSEWPEIAATQYLVPHAVRDVSVVPCLWLRGLLPGNLNALPNMVDIPPSFAGSPS